MARPGQIRAALFLRLMRQGFVSEQFVLCLQPVIARMTSGEPAFLGIEIGARGDLFMPRVQIPSEEHLLGGGKQYRCGRDDGHLINRKRGVGYGTARRGGQDSKTVVILLPHAMSFLHGGTKRRQSRRRAV